MLEARDLYCERDERTLFRGLSFTVDAGEWVQVTGGNGAGKTTLLRLLTGLARPDGGEVYWQGEPSSPPAKLAFPVVEVIHCIRRLPSWLRSLP